MLMRHVFPRAVLASGPRGCATSLLVGLSVLCVCQSARAQIRPIVIQNATILTGDGRTLEHGSVMLSGGKITAVGTNVEASFLARKINAEKKFVTPGLIDLHSTIGLALDNGVGGGMATAHAADAFNRFAADDIKAALRQGITTVYLPARSGAGVGGLGAVVSLLPESDPNIVILKRDAALSATVDGLGRMGPVQRVKSITELRRLFRAAKEYREAWEDYADDLKEYEEKLAKAAKDAPAEGKAGETKPAPNAKHSKAGEGDKPEKDADKKKDEKKDDKDKKDELKKPNAPPVDRNLATILKALDGELHVRIEADAANDILNALEFAGEYRLALILEGGAAASRVAPRLAAAHVPVILSGQPDSLAYAPGPDEDADPAAAAILAKAGVDVYFGTGVVPPGATPRLTLEVARAVGHGFDPHRALSAVTSKAADLLGLDDLGRVATGKRADLVIWSGDPFAPTSTVERVIIGGSEVYVADGDSSEGQ